jgi:hypothetical protein
MLTEYLDHKATSFPKEEPAASCAECISKLLEKEGFLKACRGDSSITDCKDLLPYHSKFAKELLVKKCDVQCETVLPRTFKAAKGEHTVVSRMANFAKSLQRNKKNDIGSDVSGAVVFIRSFQDRRSLASFL